VLRSTNVFERHEQIPLCKRGRGASSKRTKHRAASSFANRVQHFVLDGLGICTTVLGVMAGAGKGEVVVIVVVVVVGGAVFFHCREVVEVRFGKRRRASRAGGGGGSGAGAGGGNGSVAVLLRE